jgi:hypothetical protein
MAASGSGNQDGRDHKHQHFQPCRFPLKFSVRFHLLAFHSFYARRFIRLRESLDLIPNVAKAGEIQSQGAKGATVGTYYMPLGLSQCLKLSPRPEFNDITGLDFHGFARLRVAAYARFAAISVKSSESRQGYPSVFLFNIPAHRCHKTFQRIAGSSFGNGRIGSYSIN